MARWGYETPVDEKSTMEHLNLCLFDVASQPGDTNMRRAAAQAKAELWRREVK